MRRAISALAALSLLLLASPLAAAPPKPEQSDRTRFLVTFRSGVTAPGLAAHELSRAHGFSLRHVYRFALSGMAIEVPPQAELQVLRALRRDPRIATIGRDRTVYLTAQQVAKDLNRINGEPVLAPNTGSSVQVAIIDTGLDFAHPDLAANIDTALSRNCTGGSGCVPGGQDDYGHGTSVGGIVAAINNSIDLVGVASQATLIAVKVFKADGSADYVDIVAGVDYLTGLNLSGNVIEVANMSFRDNCPTCTDDSTDPTVVAFHDAVRALVNSGTTAVAAAGNDSANASGSIPAAFDEVITVSAMGDSDGIPGGLGPPLCLFWFFSCLAGAEVADDSFARTALAGFSNFGADVDVIAPGVGVPILHLGGGIVLCNEINLGNCSGTSFASPHAVGVAALFIQDRLGKSLPAPLPGTVRQALIETGECYEAGAGAGGLFHGTAGCPEVWPTDPDGLAEPLVRADNVVNFAASAVRDVAVTSLSAPSPVIIGDPPQEVTVGVENQGTVAETFDVSLADETEPFVAIIPTSHSVSLDPGGSTTLTFTWTPTSAADHVLTASADTVAGEIDTADNTRSTTVTVQSPTRDVAVTSVVAPASVVLGDTASISVVVANQGTEDESVSVAVTNAPDGDVEPNPQSKLVLVGQSETFTFSWDTTGNTLGDHTLTATATLETGTDSDPADNSQSTVVTVLEPRHDVAVTSIISQDVVNHPDPLGIQVNVANEGTYEETFEVTMTDTPPAGGTAGTWSSVYGNPQSVPLAAGASTSLIFVWETDSASAGDHILTATADTVTGETDTADNSKSKTVNLSAETVDIALTGVTAPPSATEGTVADVSVDVANLGDVETTVTVSLDDFPPPGGTPGTVSAPQPVTLAAGASTTLTFTWDTTGATAGDHLLSAIFSPVGSDGNPFNNTNSTTSTVLLAAPTNLTATAGAEVSGKGKNKTVTAWVDLAWDDNPGEEGYVVERADVTVTGKGRNKNTTVGAFDPIGSVGANTTAYHDDTVESGATYRYRVQALHSDPAVGNSPYSDEVEVKTR